MARSAELEKRVLRFLWQGEARSIRQVHTEVGSSLAYTTIATVLSRLHCKGMATRTRRGGAWIYRAARAHRDDVADRVAKQLAELDVVDEAALVTLLRRLEEQDAAIIPRLGRVLAGWCPAGSQPR